MNDKKNKKDEEIKRLKEHIKELEKTEAFRKEAEKALQENAENYHFISENTNILIAVTTLDLMPKYIYISPSYKNVMGYSSEELIGKKAMDFIHTEDKKKILQLLTKYIGIKTRENIKKEKLLKGLTIEYRVKDKKENWHCMESSVNYYKNKVLFISNDITERKKVDEELKKHRDDLEKLVKKRTFTLEEKTKETEESQQALSLLLEDVNESRAELEAKTNELNISLKNTEHEKDKIDVILKSIADGLIVTDLDNRIILMNHIVEDLLNIRLSEVLNKPLLSIITEEKLHKKLDSIASKVKKGYKFDFELLAKNTKNPIIYSAKASIIKDKKGRAIGIIITFRDVTREREIDRLKSEFISTAAHELRTPLTSIQGFSEILKIRDDLDDEKKKRFLTYINNQAVNLGNIISDLLDISRIESGMGFSLKKETCKINDCILRVFSVYKISHPNHSFYFYLPDKEAEVFVDRVKMEQVIENILSNAVKYSPHGGEIRIKGKVLGNKYMVTVEDKGIGMTPKQVEKIFEKFFRGDSSDTGVEGTGLGMSIVKYIIEAHKGNIWTESKLGKGTKVYFTIPFSLKKGDKKKK